MRQWPMMGCGIRHLGESSVDLCDAGERIITTQAMIQSRRVFSQKPLTALRLACAW